MAAVFAIGRCDVQAVYNYKSYLEVTLHIPLAGCNGDRGGAVWGAGLFTCPHLYLHFVQELMT